VKSSGARLINEIIGDELMAELQSLDALIDGEIFMDTARRLMYATDASAYRELPLAICRPRHENDICELIKFASRNKISLIPRAAGTSLAGQVVGRGMVVDISRYMTKILEINEVEKWIRVQPGVILDDMNKVLKSTGLFFSPETSTSNRCMIGGMVGNNSSGLHSVVYGSTREHIFSARIVLSDGSVAEFGPTTDHMFHEKCEELSLEGEIYRNIRDLFKDEQNKSSILAEFPDPDVVRRNTGYALDELLNASLFMGKDAIHDNFNFCRLLAGSEGTLGFTTEIKLQLDPLPPPEKVLIPVHVDSVMEAIRGNLIALKYSPAAVELMDNTILELTEGNLTQRKNRFFVKDSPGAILIVEFVGASMEEIEARVAEMKTEFQNAGIGYHFPVVKGADISKVWSLRKAGLGVLSRMEGDAKPVSVIEDTSVTPAKLEAYIGEFNLLLAKHKLDCVYHAHISVGELHLRPILNLKDAGDVELFHTIAYETAALVKKYRGSLSGEHGDGRLRGEFIPMMVGERNFSMMRSIKDTWDPNGVFNKEKIFDTPPMNSFLRYTPGEVVEVPDTIFEFNQDGGILAHIEQCNGSGDCRKTVESGGTMCPSYMASKEEWATTRARANILREFIGKQGKRGLFDHPEVYEVLDLCLACKACKSECPSSIDMAKLKTEFLQHWYDSHGIPLRTRLIAYITSVNRVGSLAPFIFNFFVKNKLTSCMVKGMMGFAKKRSIPTLQKNTLRRWCKRNLQKLNASLDSKAPEVIYFIDEFTNYNDVHIGITSIRLLNKLGIKVIVLKHALSGRSFISKGLLRTAQKHARKNVELFSDLVNENKPLIGTEPSAILGFRDEFPELVGGELKEKAIKLSEHALMIEEYIMKMQDKGLIDQGLFTASKANLKLHGHCQQKAIASTKETIAMLSIPVNYTVSEIPSGCCGMAGSFGYEKEHYDLSMTVGELVLFPEVRKTGSETMIAAPGTSCRHQIKDGTGVDARHPVEILYEALN
jgi:FAD/FMN-containing dehydrogenase/Fe-S oxidoreductase